MKPTRPHAPNTGLAPRADGNVLESGALHPMPPRRAVAGPMQPLGDVAEWTAGAYLPYPGYKAWEGAVGDYNDFSPTSTRWQFSGVRLAHDLG